MYLLGEEVGRISGSKSMTFWLCLNRHGFIFLSQDFLGPQKLLMGY